MLIDQFSQLRTHGFVSVSLIPLTSTIPAHVLTASALILLELGVKASDFRESVDQIARRRARQAAVFELPWRRGRKSPRRVPIFAYFGHLVRDFVLHGLVSLSFGNKDRCVVLRFILDGFFLNVLPRFKLSFSGEIFRVEHV